MHRDLDVSVNLQQLILGLSAREQSPVLGYRTVFRSFRRNYAELSRSIRAIGDWLTRQGITQGDRVVFWGPNSPDWVAAFLACLAAGVAAVPLDLHSAPDFVERVLDETAAKLLLRGRFQPHVAGVHLVRFFDELEWEARPGKPERTTWPSITPSDLAEIIYTSGTTARPRGVMLTHENLSANLNAIQSIVPPEPFYRFVSLLPLSHALEQMVGLFLPLSRGGEIIYIQSLKPSALVEALRQEKPNVLVVVPRFLDLLRARFRSGLPPTVYTALTWSIPIRLALRLIARRVTAFPILRQLGGQLLYVVVGGAPLDIDLERFWDSLGLLVLQGYGLSEAAPVVSANTPTCHRIGSVGKPVAGVQVSIGKDEEILVRGPNVTPGYYHRPGATAEAFVDGWLRTGDLGRFDRRGFLFILGRLKDLIITSAGLKIYPEDIETVLNRQPAVRDSVALEWNGRIFAVLLLNPAVIADPGKIIERANKQLNPVQRIQEWAVWPGSDFPRTPTLKVQKYLVREALASNRTTPANPNRPTGRVERIVADLAPDRPVTPTARLGIELDL
ncbi:MAG TPA: AMP-binding protein, partial [Chloroflexota bacterium]|nr:AMP-binding protein [Chloroflexota bacterium]